MSPSWCEVLRITYSHHSVKMMNVDMDKYSIQSGEDLLTNRLEWKVRKLIKTNDIDQGNQYCKTINIFFVFSTAIRIGDTSLRGHSLTMLTIRGR